MLASDADGREYACFRFGERLLRLETNHLPFLAALRELYGDCEVSAATVSGEPKRLAGEPLSFVPGEEGRVLARVGELFPSAGARRLPLGAAFVLRGYAERAAAARFYPRRDDMDLFKTVCSAMIVLATWGESAGRRLLKFLTVVDVLAQMRCYVLDSGAPDATADLVETLMEDS